MAKTRIVIDGDVICDKDIGAWTQSVPEVENLLPPDGKPKPWMQALLVAMVASTLTGRPFAAEICTRPGGWTLDVEQELMS